MPSWHPHYDLWVLLFVLGVGYWYANVRIRPELRWDWFVGQGRPFDSRDGGMTGTSVHQFTGALDVVLTF